MGQDEPEGSWVHSPHQLIISPLSRFAHSFDWPSYHSATILAGLVTSVSHVACTKHHRSSIVRVPARSHRRPSNWCQDDLLPGDSFAAPKQRLDISQVTLTPLGMDARDDRH